MVYDGTSTQFIELITQGPFTKENKFGLKDPIYKSINAIIGKKKLNEIFEPAALAEIERLLKIRPTDPTRFNTPKVTPVTSPLGSPGANLGGRLRRTLRKKRRKTVNKR